MQSSRLRDVLACPNCRGRLHPANETLECGSCASIYRVVDGVPVFRAGDFQIAREHVSNPLGPEFQTLLKEGRDFILNIGAGGTAQRFPNCVEFEHKIFRHTDVVGDAHRLPFRDSVFDRVFAFNVFEHLRDPKTAAGEIERVLRPGGVATIHTAFLQPLHEAPHHYYNATEFGVREWFSSLEIEQCEVSGNFSPGMMLSFLCANVLDTAAAGNVGSVEQAAISQSTVGDWAGFWRRGCVGELPPGFMALRNLPQALQARVAAGFQLVARKRAR
ncbi:MAG TPA: methyltransferase domain-containing protein [Chthoniobacterales bacterium]|nr:methyltransferase domain-containing protein [Chthoniobacterales bacterium]